MHNLTWKRAPEDPGESVGRRGAIAPCRHLPASRRTAPCSLRLFGFDSTVLEVAQSTHQAVSPLFTLLLFSNHRQSRKRISMP